MATFYNEIDKSAAEWMRQLIAAGEITQGRVNETSIADIGANDLAGFTRVHFFAGIGGWDYALRLAGWPEDLPVWTGSCPCQPFSAAGKRKGANDERHLWPEFRRLIAECTPPIVFGEQVASKDGRLWLDGVRSDLEALGYAVGAADLCSAGIGAPNLRQRLYWVAISNRPGQQSSGGEPRTSESRDDRGWRGEISGVGKPTSLGNRAQPVSGVHSEVQREGRIGELGGSSAFGGVGNSTSNEQRRERQPYSSNGRTCETGGSSTGGYWDAFDVLPCLDGKTRRVEPGSFPLVAGISGRVGQSCYPGPPFDPQACAEGRVMRLRGYGNAINPQLAAEFIRAVM